MNKLGDYPVWLFMFIGQIVLPMLGCASVAIKILVKTGKDMQRQLLGVGAKPGKFEGKQKEIQKEIQMVSPHNMAERMILEMGLALTRTMINVQTDEGNQHEGQAANQDSVQVPVQSGLNNLANLPGLVPGV